MEGLETEEALRIGEVRSAIWLSLPMLDSTQWHRLHKDFARVSIVTQSSSLLIHKIFLFLAYPVIVLPSFPPSTGRHYCHE